MQDTQTFNRTIAGNIGYGLSEEEATPEVIERAARLANAHEFIATFPDGYDTRLGERGVRLSGGQKQRLAVARVFLRNPSLLLLDEATSALDLESEHAVQQALDRLVARGGKTAIIVAHRLSTVRHADAIHVVGGGKVVERGTHDELVGREGGAYAALLSLQEKKRKETVGEGE
jgi:ATP-binding cassette subfamily B protein